MTNYQERVAKSLEGLEAVSTGVCPGCSRCAKDHGYHPDNPESMQAFEDAWCNGEIQGEPSFSWRSCGICHSPLGGDREPWHYVQGGEIYHESGACVDCIAYLANGTIPEEREGAQS